jgi:hypothetical protein
LAAFSKGWFQQVAKGYSKFWNKRGIYTQAEQFDALREIIHKVVWAQIVGVLVASILGKWNEDDKHNPYNIMAQMSYTLGGLGAAAAQQIATFIFAFTNGYVIGAEDYLFPTKPGKKPSEFNRRMRDKAIVSLTKTADSMLPFYEQTLDAVEAFVGAKNIDMQGLRKLRSLIDKKYEESPKSRYQIRRNLIEGFQKGILGAEGVGEEPKKGFVPPKIKSRRGRTRARRGRRTRTR